MNGEYSIMIEINKEQAILVMEQNLKRIKECSETETFLLLSYDLEKNMSICKKRMTLANGKSLVKKSKTFVLNKDNDEDSVSTLSIYSERQKDIYNIIPIGKKHDMIIIPQNYQKIANICSKNRLTKQNTCSII